MKSFDILLINIYEKKKKKNETIVQYSGPRGPEEAICTDEKQR
jgi:hypothetical protein